MRIALLSYELPPDTGFGGIGTYAWYQARALVRLGHSVHVFAGSLTPGEHSYEVDGVRVTRVLEPGVWAAAADASERDGMPWSANRLRTAAGAYAALGRAVTAGERFDVVEYPECGADGMLVSTLTEIPTCVRFHSPAALIMADYGADPRDIEATTFLEKVAVDRAVIRTSPSQFLAEEAVARLGARAPVHVVRNGLDLADFDRDPGTDVRSLFGLPAGDAVTLLFTGRLERRKGADLLPEICAALLAHDERVHVVLAGADDASLVDHTIVPRLEASGPGARSRLHALGRRSPTEVRALLKACDAFLLPSRWENAPYSCIEAMAAGVAVVASDVGGLGEMVTSGADGILVPVGDAAAFVEALCRLVDDAPLRERLGAAARATVEARHRDVDVAERTVAIWRDHLA